MSETKENQARQHTNQENLDKAKQNQPRQLNKQRTPGYNQEKPSLATEKANENCSNKILEDYCPHPVPRHPVQGADSPLETCFWIVL